jgi:hypothetical protein
MAIDTLLKAEGLPEELGASVVLRGAAASGGCASRRARVLTTPEDVRLARGEILVLPDLRSVMRVG